MNSPSFLLKLFSVTFDFGDSVFSGRVAPEISLGN